uniref:Secreted protein n=1 Tax=Tetradesmus obliquus TaxID=3088 RepID=A0A383WP39_TETOB|eukprot:jgi/Sobl393_1/4601/SZX79228.1
MSACGLRTVCLASAAAMRWTAITVWLATALGSSWQPAPCLAVAITCKHHQQAAGELQGGYSNTSEARQLPEGSEFVVLRCFCDAPAAGGRVDKPQQQAAQH